MKKWRNAIFSMNKTKFNKSKQMIIKLNKSKQAIIKIKMK